MTLSELFHDTVDEIEPTDRLAEIRARTTAPAPVARPWWYAAGGVVLATAAAVTAFAVLDVEGGGSEREHHHVATAPRRSSCRCTTWARPLAAIGFSASSTT